MSVLLKLIIAGVCSSQLCGGRNLRSLESPGRCDHLPQLQRRKFATKLKMCQMSQNLFFRCVSQWDEMLLVIKLSQHRIVNLEILTFRCGLTAHTSCLATIPEEMQVCRYGVLEPIFLPPTAVSIPRTQISQVNFIGVKTKESSVHLYR